MASPLRRIAIQKTANHVASLPPPVGGWNARDALANMPPTDAVALTNLFPGVSSCDLRGGNTVYATGMNGAVETLMIFNGATSKMFAVDANGKSIYDVTAGGAVGAPVVTGLTNARWEYANISTPGGRYMYAVNGLDKPLLYTGVANTWTPIDGVSVPAITGVTSTSLTNVLLFKNRLWFIERDTLKVWYLPTLSIGGAAQLLDLSAFATQGGALVDMIAWTVDAGYGADDNLVLVSSKGEVFVFRGTDPSSASTWSLMGVWQIGAPIGKRCMLKYGGDSLILTLDGLLPLAQALQSSRLDPRVALTDKIQGAIGSATSTYQTNFGWEIFYYPKQNALWLNVPISPTLQEQFATNTITGAWCNFTNWAANCWGLLNDEPYFGANGQVRRAWDLSYTDNAANIESNSVQAFNYFEQRGVEKYFTRARPNIITTGNPAIQIGVVVDYNLSESVTPISYPNVTFALWDLALWDASLWGQSLTLQSNWQGIAGIGYCAGVQLKTASKGLQIQWASTDIVFQAGWAGI